MELYPLDIGFAVCVRDFFAAMVYNEGDLIAGGIHLDQEKIGKFIGAMRKRQGMTQEQLGETFRRNTPLEKC